MQAGNLMIVQGGGPTAVFNTSLAAVIDEAQRLKLGRVFGAKGGTRGLCTESITELTQLSRCDLEDLRNSPGAALGSSRYSPTEGDLDRSVDLLRRLGVSRIVFMGGNGTMRGAEAYRNACVARGLDVQVGGVPKTIDNDIACTDRCPGFGSAARYVAQSVLDLAMDIRSLPQPVSIVETLGRDVGWLAAASTLAKHASEEAPHIVCLPEVPFVLETFLSRLDDTVSRIGWAIIVVSEGTRYANGTPVFQQHLPPRDGKQNRPLIGGVAQHLSGLVAEHLGLRARSEKPGLIGRSCMAHVSVQDRGDAELVGRESVRALAAGITGQMIALHSLREGESRFGCVPLAAVATVSRALPAEWLSTDALAVNDGFQTYARPIIGDLKIYRALLS